MTRGSYPADPIFWTTERLIGTEKCLTHDQAVVTTGVRLNPGHGRS
jgi:hypothetical protein